jgi:hypothetical protein
MRMKWWMLLPALALVPGTAMAQKREVWTCTYIDFGDSHQAVVMRFAVAGRELLNLTTNERLTITVNNGRGIVAVGSPIGTASRDKPSDMVATVVLIDRRADDLNFNITLASTIQRRNANRQGHCARD